MQKIAVVVGTIVFIILLLALVYPYLYRDVGNLIRFGTPGKPH